MTMDDGIIEQEIQRKGLTAPRVTPQDLEDNIIGEHYQAFASTTTTVCCLILRNGFTVIGESACASPENFDAELGRKIALEDAKRKIWPLMGYALREMLATEPKTAKDRAVVERDQLAERLGKLDGFIGTSNYLALPSETQALLSSQRQYMGGYLAALEQRLAAWD
jgi:hypothetical protein